MRTATCLAAVVILATVATTPSAAERRISDTIDASCVVRITVDAGMIPLNQNTVEALVLSSSVAGKAARDVLGRDLKPEEQETIRVDWLSKLTMPGLAPQEPRSSEFEPWDYEREIRRSLRALADEQMRLMREGGDEMEGKQKPDAQSPPRGHESSAPSSSGRGGGRGGGGFGGVSGDMMMDAPDAGGTGMSGSGMMGGMGTGMSDYYDAMGQGMGGFGAMYRRVPSPTAGPGAQQDAIIRLSVHLEDTEPMAKEFLTAIVENLRQTLQAAHERYKQTLVDRLREAERRREYMEGSLKLALLGRLTGEGEAPVRKQLDTIVDLSTLSPEMAFSEAIEVLGNSVEPPLEIAVLWGELLDNAEIAPDSAIELDPLRSVQMRTGLELLLKAVARGGKELTYRIYDNVIVISTATPLATSQTATDGHASEADVRALYLRKHELTREIQNLELELAGMEARREAIQRQIAVARVEAAERTAGDTVTRELQKLVDINQANLSRVEELVRKSAASEASLGQAQESLMRAKIELAQRREALAQTAGGGQIDQFNTDLSRIAIDRAEKRARLQVLRIQLEEVQNELAQASKVDPRAARIRLDQQALDVADRQLLELQNRWTNLEKPTVTMVGAD